MEPAVTYMSQEMTIEVRHSASAIGRRLQEYFPLTGSHLIINTQETYR